MTTLTTSRVFNFNAGPSVLPLEVLEQAQKEFVSLGSTGQSVMEMSHRDKEFVGILERAEKGLRANMGIPDDYTVLFLGGGASLQFAMVPMNLAAKGKPVQIIHTGAWTQKALEELKKGVDHQVIYDGAPDKFMKLPDPSNLQVDPNASYVHICSNNTIEGTQFRGFPNTGAVPLVADMSSDILSRPVDVKKFGLIFAGAQKNLGPAGATVVVIRKDLIDKSPSGLPAMLQYKVHAKEPSLYNTPPTYPIYILALVMEWIARQGGVAVVERKNEQKAALLYSTIDKTGFYACPVDKSVRSRMNIVFRIKGGDEKLEELFVKESKAAGMVGLKGHRSVGGLRASLYNAQTVEAVEALVGFMKEFEKRNG